MKPEQLIHVAHELSGRWTIPILLALKKAGGRFTPLQHLLGISPSRLSANLKKMEEQGILLRLSPADRRHPLLPEYQLTEKGALLKEAAKVIHETENELGFGFLAEKSWNWPVLLAIYYEYNRFQEIRQLLQEPTPRILSMRIQELCHTGLINKTVSVNPRPGYIYLLESSARPPIRRMNDDIQSMLS